MPDHAQLLPGILDLLILRAVSLESTRQVLRIDNCAAKTAAQRNRKWNRLVAAIASALSAQPGEL